MAKQIKRNSIENLVKAVEGLHPENGREFFLNKIKNLDSQGDVFACLLDIVKDKTITQRQKFSALSLMCEVAEKKHATTLLKLFADDKAEKTYEDDDKPTFWAYHYVLVALQSKKIAPFLLKLLPTVENLEKREVIVYVLGWGITRDKKADERVIEPLIKILTYKNEHEKVRGQAAESLALIESYHETKHSFDSLVQCLSDESAEVRFWCCYGLGQIGGEEAIPHLEKMLTDKTEVPFWWSVGKEAQDMIDAIRDSQEWRQEWQAED